MPEGLSRRDFLTGVLATGIASAAATYFAKGGRASPTATLRMAAARDGTGAQDTLISMWNSANPSAKIQFTPLDGGTIDQLNAALSMVQAQQVDILNLDIIDIPLFVSRGYLAPVDPSLFHPDDFLAKTVVPSRLGSADPQATHWAVPFQTNVGMLFVRGASSAVASSGDLPPLPAVVDTIVAPQSRQFAGQLLPQSSSSAEAFAVNVLEHAVCRDARVLGEYGAPSDALEVWQTALTPLRAAVLGGKLTQAVTEDDTADAFQDGRLGFMRNWPVEYQHLQQFRDADAESANIRIGHLPYGVLGGNSLATVAGSPVATQANAFIAFMTSGPAQEILASYGGTPAATSAYANPQLATIAPRLGVVRGAVEQARLRPVNKNYRDFSRILVSNVNDFLQNGTVLTTAFLDQLLATLHR
jgi:multiple sugar transport system substrate-binding protein